ncbi:uncharacterized protein [Montipora foliosa]|uniref:uncharacterized protein n=1 Tax=Montipora foliosa TaxID=591990 RepID=UPI0035F1AC0F
MVYSKKKTGVQSPKSQTDDNKCSCSLLLKGSTPFSVMLPTTLSGKLFHAWTAVWMNVWPVETVVDTARKCLKTLNLSLQTLSDKRKLSRKKHNFDLAKSDFYPPEGHSCANLLAVEAQEIECDEDGEDMTSLTKAAINGASLPSLQGGTIIAHNFSPGSTELRGQLIIWGGINTRTMEPSNELITLDPVKRKNIYLGKIWKSGPCDQEYPFLQTGSSLSPRSGHTLTCVPGTRFAILLGGLQLPNRHSKSFIRNRFARPVRMVPFIYWMS